MAFGQGRNAVTLTSTFLDLLMFSVVPGMFKLWKSNMGNGATAGSRTASVGSTDPCPGLVQMHFL